MLTNLVSVVAFRPIEKKDMSHRYKLSSQIRGGFFDGVGGGGVYSILYIIIENLNLTSKYKMCNN